MIRFPPGSLMMVGFLLVLIGFLVPFLTVIKIIEANLFLLLASYGASVAGLFLGVVGAAYYTRQR